MINLLADRLNMTKLSISGLTVIILICSLPAFSQQKDRVKLERAEYLENGELNGERFDKVIGNVAFSQKETRIFGDSAFFFKQKNLVEIFGRVRVLEGDSITITGKRLIYHGNTKLAQMRENVVYRDPTMTLNTDFLDYDMPDHMAYYYDGGRLVTESNRLTSKKGYYDTKAKYASFKDSVVLKNPDYTVEADTFQFNTVTEVAYFLGPTLITARNGTILNADDGGEYDTRQEIGNFTGAAIETPKYLLNGKQLFGDETKEFYTATDSVTLISKNENVIISGDHGKYWKSDGLTKVYGNALMKKVFADDTLYLTADTLINIEDSIAVKERQLAFHNVRIFKPDLQGRADSLSYQTADSLIYLYGDPVLWNENNQMVADTIYLMIKNGTISRMFMNNKAFVTGETAENFYDQVKGRKMTAYFTESKLSRVDVNGNGESLYFELEQDSLVMGMNKVICSDMKLLFQEQKISDIVFYSPDGSFIPFHEIKSSETRLEDFNWRPEERPTREDVIGPPVSPALLPDDLQQVVLPARD